MKIMARRTKWVAPWRKCSSEEKDSDKKSRNIEWLNLEILGGYD
jgi:hypothetical protein